MTMDNVAFIILPTLVVICVVLLVLIFFVRNNQKRKRAAWEKKMRLAREEERKRMYSEVAPNITNKLKSGGGLSSLNEEEKGFLFTLIRMIGKRLHPNEIEVIEYACSDQAIFNMLQLRNSQFLIEAMNVNSAKLTSISSNVRNSGTAQMVTGLAAANHLGQQMSD